MRTCAANLLFIALFSILFLDYSNVIAQKADSLARKRDTLSTDNEVHISSRDTAIAVKPKSHSAKKALLYSALLPGLGQAYNKKYWKMPIIYAGLGVMVYFIITNNRQYVAMQNALLTRSSGGIDLYQQYSTTQLTTLRDQWHYNRDLSVVGATLVYALNLLDAEVDGQFFSFNMSDDISAHFTPTISSVAAISGFTAAPAIAFVINF